MMALHELVYVNDKVRNNIQVFSAPSSFDPIEFSLYSNEQDDMTQILEAKT